MKSTILALAAIVFGLSSAMAATPSQSTEQFCADRSDSNFVKELAYKQANLMAFRNYGGLAGGGVCWWHSRFQRNALYLTIYKPAEKKPTKEEAIVIIGKIRAAKTVVVIPGYANFYEFSYNHQEEIQKELERWQKSDGIKKFNWVMGLKGLSEVSPEKLKAMMDELYIDVEKRGNISYQKLQIKGVVAHAWLVLSMKKVGEGYILEIIDSNYPNQVSLYDYRNGETNLNLFRYGNFVPYLEREKEMNEIKAVIAKKCE